MEGLPSLAANCRLGKSETKSCLLPGPVPGCRESGHLCRQRLAGACGGLPSSCLRWSAAHCRLSCQGSGQRQPGQVGALREVPGNGAAVAPWGCVGGQQRASLVLYQAVASRPVQPPTRLPTLMKAASLSMMPKISGGGVAGPEPVAEVGLAVGAALACLAAGSMPGTSGSGDPGRWLGSAAAAAWWPAVAGQQGHLAHCECILNGCHLPQQPPALPAASTSNPQVQACEPFR